MLMILPIVLALVAGDPAPAATSAPSAASPGGSTIPGARPTPLQEIGRVRALPACVPIVAHANGAISSALDNDRTLAIMSTNLHNTDYDRLNSLQRKNAIEAALKQAGDIRDASRGADAEIKKLREYAAAATDPVRKQELKEFADALGGALDRQKKAAAEFQRGIAIMQGREETGEARATMRQSTAMTAPPEVLNTMSKMAAAQGSDHILAATPDGPPESYTKAMRGYGDELDDLMKGIALDEGAAADHSIAATSGC